MPTRSGKSLVIAAVLHTLRLNERLPTSVGIVTSRTLLVDDLYQMLKRGLPDVGRVDGHKKSTAQVIVTTYQSLHLCPRFDLLICDEAHRTKGKRFRKEMARHGQRVGFSATPHGANDRDGLPFDEVWYDLRYEQAKEQGVVVPWVPVWPVGEPIPPGDDGLLDPRRALPEAVRMIRDRGGPDAIGPILFTAQNLTVAAWIAERLREEGWSAVAAVPKKKGVEGYTRKGIRKLIGAFQRGEPQCLVTVDWLAEGVTIPALRAVVLTSPPRGRNHLCQLCGRAMGVCEADKWGEKKEAIIFDPCGVLLTHKLEHSAAMGELHQRPKSVKRQAQESVARLEALPYAVRLTALEAWAAAIWRAADSLARPPGYRQPEPLGVPNRRLPATERDRVALRSMLGLVSYVSGEWHRVAIRALAESTAELPRGVVVDLIATLVRVRAVRSALAKAGAPYWRLAQAGIVRVGKQVKLPALPAT